MQASSPSSRYTLWSWVVAIGLALGLVLTWLAGYGPARVCCQASEAAATAATTSAPSASAAAPTAPGSATDSPTQGVASAAAAKQPSADCMAALSLATTFEAGSAVLTAPAKAGLKATASCITEVTLIAGHTDSQGQMDSNMRLSERRAQAVASYLISQGVAPHLLKVEGYGPTQPIADNNSPQGRAQNRRIEFSKL